MRFQIPEIKEIKKYAVSFKGDTYYYDSFAEASECRRECEVELVHDYMESLGIPEKGLYIVWANKTRKDGKSHNAVIIFNNKCVAYGEYRDDKLVDCGHATEWLDDHIVGLNLNDFLKDFDKKYRKLLKGKHLDTSKAFKETWGQEDDGVTIFESVMHPDITEEGVNIITVSDAEFEDLDEIKYSLARYINCDPDELTREYESLYTKGYAEYYVFENVDKAHEYVLEDYGPEYCNGAISDEEWYSMIEKESNYDEDIINCCFPKGKDEEPDYKEIASYILASQGVAWFLASYDGNAMHLDYKDYVAYRRN